MVVEYYARGRRRHHAGAARPADGARALAQGRARGHRAGTGYGDKADAFYQKRVPKGAPDYVETAHDHLPVRPHRRRGLPDRARGRRRGRRRWARSPSTRGRCAATDADHPDELRIDLDPQPGTDFRDAVRVAGVARELLDDLGWSGFPKTSGNRGVHVYVRIEPRWDFVDVRHAAIAFGRELERRTPGVTTKLVEGGARRERSSSTTTRTAATAPSPPPTACGPSRARRSRTPMDVGRAGRGRGPARPQPVHRAGPVRRARRPARRASTTSHSTSSRCSTLYDEQGPAASCPTRRTTRRCRASRRGCSPARRSPRTGTSSAVSGAAGSPGPDRLHSTAPLTRAWARVTFQPSARRTVFEMSNRGALRQPVQP